MSKRFALFLSFAAAALLIWWNWFTAALPAFPSTKGEAPTASSSPRPSLPPRAVMNIDPKFAGRATNDGTAAKRIEHVVSSQLEHYLARKDFPTLLGKLTQAADDPEALFLRAQILERCARITDANAPRAAPKPVDERRAAFVAGLKADARETAVRLAAYDTVNADPCGDLHLIETSRKELAELRAKASEMKDAAALARDLNCEIFGSIDRANGGRFPEINDTRFDRIRAAMISRNPIAVRTGVGMLANTYRNGAFRLGPDGKPVDPNIMAYVANLMACQFGADCSADVLRACANDGKCNVNSYEDYLAFYQLSPNDAQLAERYREWLTQMIDSGNFSQLQLVQGEQSTDSVRIGSYFSCTN